MSRSPGTVKPPCGGGVCYCAAYGPKFDKEAERWVGISGELRWDTRTPVHDVVAFLTDEQMAQFAKIARGEVTTIRKCLAFVRKNWGKIGHYPKVRENADMIIASLLSKGLL